MSKIKLLLLSSMLIFGLTACNSQPAQSPNKIGVMDANRVFEESDAGKLGIERLTAMQDELQVELDGLQAEFDKNPDNADAMLKMQQAYQLFQVRYNAEQQSLVAVFDAALMKSIENVRAKLSLDVVLAKDAVLTYSDQIDITKEIITDFNAQKIELPPMQPKTPAVEMPAIEEQAPATGQTPAAQEEDDQPQGMHGY